MIDIRTLRDDPERLRKGIEAKNEKVDLDRLIALDGRRRELSGTIDELNRRRNEQSKAIGPKIKAGENVEELKAEVRKIGEELKAAEGEAAETEEEWKALRLRVPNMPHPTAPLRSSSAISRATRRSTSA